MREAVLNATHDVADDTLTELSDEEGLGKLREYFVVEVVGVMFGKRLHVYRDYCRDVSLNAVPDVVLCNPSDNDLLQSPTSASGVVLNKPYWVTEQFK